MLKAFKKGACLGWRQPPHLCRRCLTAAVARHAEFCCNGNVVEDTELGKVIQLQGDQRKNVSIFLTGNKLASKDLIKARAWPQRRRLAA